MLGGGILKELYVFFAIRKSALSERVMYTGLVRIA